jgi:hypothetical protein
MFSIFCFKSWLSEVAARNDSRPHLLTENMGGRSVRREPTLLQVTEQAREILHRLGWTEYFNRLQGYDTNIMLEFFQNLQGGVSMVRDI